jgi:Sec-independent protein translocase protein TatA
MDPASALAAPPLLLFDIGAMELILVAILAIMLYGGDLPDVARKAGATVRRLRGVADDLKRQVTLPPDPELQRLPADIDPRREPAPAKPAGAAGPAKAEPMDVPAPSGEGPGPAPDVAAQPGESTKA